MENLVILFAFFCAFESIDYFFKPIGFFVFITGLHGLDVSVRILSIFNAVA